MNMTVCDKFEPTMLDGQLCYSLDVAKLTKRLTKEGKDGGLFLLIDPNPEQFNFGGTHEEKGSQPFAFYINTLKQYTASEGGAYAMRNLKRMTATESFELLPDSQKACQVHNMVECQTKEFLDQVKRECNCIPWSLMANDTALCVKPFRNLEIKNLQKMMTLAPIFSSQNYFR